MPRHDGSGGVWCKPGRKCGTQARKTRTKHGGAYAIKNGATPEMKMKRKSGKK